ncbi:MAG TPA: S-adenosylmethionine:tRNA ribosyltransferase-isomerase, partial [Pseudonocardiaceae bacterium]
MTVLDFALATELEAREPPEVRGRSRADVRLLAGTIGTGEVSHHRFTDLPDLLRPGDVLVVNTSATVPAAVPITDSDLTLHLSTERPDGTWLIELRRNANKATVPYPGGAPGDRHTLPGGAELRLSQRFSRERLWIAELRTNGFRSTQEYLRLHGMPIRYGYVPKAWPISAYQTVFATQPGSAEMPSAGRPFTDRLVTRLVAAGVLLAPVLLHTGVASPEAHERPYPERFAVSATTACLVNQARAAGGRVIAVGTTVVRALESAVVGDVVAAADGWTELIVTPERGVRAVD